MSEIDRLELAWMGGIIDGEGYLKKRIQIVMQDREVLVPFYNRFGGTLKLIMPKGYLPPSRKKSNLPPIKRDTWIWYISNKWGCINFIMRVLPYLRNPSKIRDACNLLSELGVHLSRYKDLIPNIEDLPKIKVTKTLKGVFK